MKPFTPSSGSELRPTRLAILGFMTGMVMVAFFVAQKTENHAYQRGYQQGKKDTDLLFNKVSYGQGYMEGERACQMIYGYPPPAHGIDPKPVRLGATGCTLRRDGVVLYNDYNCNGHFVPVLK
jgi:hypothetical protein